VLKALRAHTAKITQNWLKANMLDLSMWSVFEREVSKQPHNTLASLGAKILEEMADMDREVVIHSYKKFWSRI
jgi:hypothetical protein